MPDAVHSLEPDRERARAIAERRAHPAGDRRLAGAWPVEPRHGRPRRDGVCVEPPEYLLGFRRFEHVVYRAQPEGRPSGPGDLDLVVYRLPMYCHLAL